GRRADPWDRPAPHGRPDDWSRVAGAGGDDRPATDGWETVLPPVGGTPRRQDSGAAGVDEATTFMSQWGPPPLRSNEERDPGSPEWGRPAPSRAGAGRSADNPAPPPRPGPEWSRPSAALPPVADAPPAQPGAGSHLPAAPTEPAAERWIADRLAADRSATAGVEPADERFAGYWTTDRPAKRPARPADPDGSVPDESTGRARAGRPGNAADEHAAGRATAAGAGASATRPPADRAGNDPISGWAVGRPGTDERFAGYWARDSGERGSAGRDDSTEVMGPFDVGAWSQDAAVSPARPRGRQRQAERSGPVTAHPDDRAGIGSGGGGGGGAQPPNRSGGGGPQRRRRTFGDRIRTFLRGIGQTFITLGLVLLLLAGYEVWFTDVLNHRTQKDLTTALQEQWDEGDDPTVGAPTKPGEQVRSIPLGDGFALIYIPDFGTDYVYTVVEGTGTAELNEGPGHYVDSVLPGQVGNFAVAGHRVGKGSPFLNLDKLKAGSAIVIRTKTYWYTYRVLGDTRTGNPRATGPLGIPGLQIVSPTEVGVIAPVPNRAGVKPTQRLLTFTTCHPKFSARQRLVIHAQLEGSTQPTSKGLPPALATGGG
ncbi:MAG TPA: class E sortase, partial [Mycobacteriales bacterium]|nr:class E sortase [Mycobacteriales bacterium]